MKLIKKIQSLIFDTSRSLKERVFIMLTFIALGVVVLALIGDIVYADGLLEIIGLTVTLVAVPLLTYIGVKRNRVDLSTRIISLGVVLVVMPLSFFFGGGIYGGTIPWLVFSYLYIGLVLYGAWRVTMLIVLTIVIFIFYYVGFYFPDLIPVQTKTVQFIDSFLAVIEVGFVCFVMTWFQNKLFMDENKRAREETKKVEELNNSQNRFFSSMSHEIRTPINSILGLNEIILRQSDVSEEVKRDATNIQGAGRMLLALINDILDFSKIEAGKMDIVPVKYTMESLVSEIVNMMWLRAQQKGLELKIEIDPSIPAELFGDEVRIKQILINILNNAVKYTNEGSVTLHIEKEAINDDQVALSFSVSDTGMGIKQDALPYLFDAFQRVDEENTSKIEGTGLGLSIVKQLVDLMGGRITVNSIYTEGSTFIVTLWQKIIRSESVGNINISSYNNTVNGSTYQVGFTAPDARVLIVDDNEMNLEVERRLLDGTEMTIDTATSGREALRLTSANVYDIIFMDHLMPEMDGIECMQNIRKQVAGLNNRVPIIALTANAGGENKELYKRSGFEDYLVKPVSGRQLEDMILSQLPESKIILSKDTDISRLSMNTTKGYSKRIPVLITTGSICDLPRRDIKKYQIDCIPFTVSGEGKTYFEGLEAQTDELLRYRKEGHIYESETPSVEDYEQFFAAELKKALNVIYISSAKSISKEYSKASEAARAYGNVEVFDSGVGSTAIGILVMLAQRFASRGESVEKILEELTKARAHVHCSFVTDGILYMRTRDAYSKGIADVMKTFSIRPIIKCKESIYKLEKIGIGELENVYKSYIDYALPSRSKPDTNLIFVMYCNLTDEQKEAIRTQILLKHPFERVVFQKTGPVMGLNVGAGALGLAFYDAEVPDYRIGSMLTPDYIEDVKEEAAPEEGMEETFIPDKKWYENIEGINGAMAIENSGSEEVFRTVLKIFYESLDNKLSEINEMYNAEDFENYTIKVHALKSSAKLVGAQKLSEDALALEMAGKEGNTAYIKENHEAMVEELTEFQEKLSEFFEGDDSVYDEGEILDDLEPKVLVSKESDGNYDAFLIESILETLEDGIKNKNRELISNTVRDAAEYSLPPELEDKLRKIKMLLEEEKENYDEMQSVLADS